MPDNTTVEKLIVDIDTSKNTNITQEKLKKIDKTLEVVYKKLKNNQPVDLVITPQAEKSLRNYVAHWDAMKKLGYTLPKQFRNTYNMAKQTLSVITQLKTLSKNNPDLTIIDNKYREKEERDKLRIAKEEARLAKQKAKEEASISSKTARKRVKPLNDEITKLSELSGRKLEKSLKNIRLQLDALGKGASKELTKELEKARRELQKFENQADKTTSHGKVWSSKLTTFAAKVTILSYGFNRFSSWFKSFINSSNAYIENLNLFRVTFGEMADEAERFAKTYSEALGLDISEVTRNMGFFNQILSGYGIKNNEAYQMSKLLTQLAYDLSSFVNIDIDEAMNKFQSGIAGELEPLRRVGYALDEVTLQQVAYNHGIQKSIRTMSQAEKAYLRLWAMYEQSANVMGDLGATITSPANAMRIMAQQFTLFKRSIGNALVPIIMKLIPVIQGATKALTEFFNLIADNLGKTEEGARQEAYAEYMNNIAKSAEEAEDALNGTLLSFDKFSSLNSNKDTSGQFSLPIPDYDALATLAKSSSDMIKWYEKFRNLLLNDKGDDFSDWIKGLIKTLQLLWNVVEKVYDAIFKLVEKVLVPFVLPVLSKVIGFIADILNKLFEMLKSLKAFEAVLYAIIAIFIGYRVIKGFVALIALFKAMTAKSWGLFGAVSAIVGLAIGLSQVWDSLHGWQKVVGIIGLLTASFFGLALAVGAFHSAWSLGLAVAGIVAGVMAVVGVIANAGKTAEDYAKNSSRFAGGFATGGFTPETTGSLFMAGENGRPELMGTVKGKNAVANVDSIETAMEQASYRGMAMAISQNNKMAQGDNKNIILQIDGKELARANVKNTANALSRNYRVELNPR